MNKFLKVVSYSFFFTVLFFISSCGNSVSINDSKTQKVAKAVDSVRISLQNSLGKSVPSMNILIHTPSDIIFYSSASLQANTVTKDTYFRFASNTKNFTAVSILNMMEDGWLNIYAYITDTIPGTNITYVPSTPEWNFPNKSQITIENLLQHSAGVYDLGNDTVPGCGGTSYVDYMETLEPNHQFSSSELVNQLTINNLYYFTPGTNYHYSNTGYTILSEIIARVYSAKSGQTKLYSDYLYDYIVGGSSPVKLNLTFPHLASDKTLPSPHVSGTGYGPGGIILTYDDANMSAYVAEGNGIGTLSSLDTYIRSLMKGANVLTAPTLELMKNSISPGSTTYGLGCTHIINLGYGHTGATHGYLSIMFYDPQSDVSVTGFTPMIDFSNGIISVSANLNGLINAGYAARAALGFSGKP